MKPFLKWAGGKYKIIDRVREKLPNGAQRGALIRIADLGKWAMAGLQLSRGGLFKLRDYA